jgi:hypothetical protein
MTSQIYDVTSAPIAWVADWVGPHEGGMTLAMKYVWANALDGPSASKSICGKTLVSNYSQRVHGRSFLTPGWARTASVGRMPSIGALIARRNIERYAGRWGQWLASDKCFRYCPECIRVGYQSLLYQVDALALCPLHRTPLLSACPGCATPTPRYALTVDAMTNPFCCPGCGTPYGGKFDPRSWRCGSFHKEASSSLRPLTQFLLQLDRNDFDWLHWDAWFGPWLGEVEQREKRVATFDVLSRIIRHRIDQELFTTPQRTLSVLKGRAVASTARSRVPLPSDSQTHYSIYKAIRRHFLKRLSDQLGRRLRFDSGSTEINLRSEILWLSLKKCPYLQALWLWRLRFEQLESAKPLTVSRRQKLPLREDAQNWPWKGGGDEAAFAYYVFTSFHTAAETVSDWWEKASRFASLPLTDQGNARSMELHMEFANLLSPSRLPVPPRITAVFGPGGSRQTERALYVVGPKHGFEKLQACRRFDSSNAVIDEMD